MQGLGTRFVVAAAVLSLTGHTGLRSAAYDAGTSRPPIMSRWLVIPEAPFWPMSEVVFLPLMLAMSKNPNEAERAQLETWKQPYTSCLLAKGYKPL